MTSRERQRAAACAALDTKAAEIVDWVRCEYVTDPETSDTIKALCRRIAKAELENEDLRERVERLEFEKANGGPR